MKDYFKDCITSIIDIVKIISIQEKGTEGKPFGEGVNKALEYTLNLTENFGFMTKNIEGYIGYSEIGEGELFGILGHLDVVPIGNGWTYKHGEIADNVLYGRGVMDDKGPMYLCLYAIKQLLDEGYKPTKRIRLIWGCNEESGWKCIDRYMQTEEVPKEGFSPDSDFPVINCEKGIVHYMITFPINDKRISSITGGERANMVADKCVLDFDKLGDRDIERIEESGLIFDGKTVIAHGVSAHGSTPFKGDNAIWKILALAKEMRVKTLSFAYDKLGDYYGKKCSLDINDEVSGRLTMNIGTATTENGKISMEIDIRHPISYKRDDILKILKDELSKGIPDLEIYETMNHNSLYVAKDNKLVKTLLNAYNSVTGDNAEPITIGGGTYARALPLGVAFGPILPGHKSTIHEKNECATLDELQTAYKIYYQAIKDLLFKK